MTTIYIVPRQQRTAASGVVSLAGLIEHGQARAEREKLAVVTISPLKS